MNHPQNQPDGMLTTSGTSELVFVKLGGSLITDKTRPFAVVHQNVERLASEIRQALDERPELQLILGHGSGSFGHWAAKPYGTRYGVHTESQWRGFAHVSAAANRLNQIVTDVFLDAGVPVLSIQPSATALCHDGTLVQFDSAVLLRAVGRRLVPLLYGDVSWDTVRGGTIVSTEELFFYLAQRLHPTRILLLGETPGVLDNAGQVIPSITLASLPHVREVLKGSRGVDVTGGMESKVLSMLDLVTVLSQTVVFVLGGNEPGLVRDAILNVHFIQGTRIERSSTQ